MASDKSVSSLNSLVEKYKVIVQFGKFISQNNIPKVETNGLILEL